MTIRLRTLATALLLGALLFPADLIAQDRERVRGPEGRQQMEQMLRERFERMIVDRLELEPAQATRLRELTRDMMEDRRALALRERRLQARMAALGADVGEGQATALLAEVLNVQDEELRLRNREVAELRAFLSDRQILLLFRVREEMGRRIREVRGERGPGGSGGWDRSR